jgi:hypothetical protein
VHLLKRHTQPVKALVEQVGIAALFPHNISNPDPRRKLRKHDLGHAIQPSGRKKLWQNCRLKFVTVHMILQTPNAGFSGPERRPWMK